MTPEEPRAAQVAAAWSQLDEPTRDRVRWASMRLGDALDALAGDPGPDPAPPADSRVQDRLARYLKSTPSFACPRCRRISFQPRDVAEGYCGACHDWTAVPGGAP